MKLTRRELFLCLGGLLASCGVTGQEPDYTIIIGNGTTFEPASLTVPIGSAVAWHNQSANLHTVTTDPQKARMPERVSLPGDASPFDSGDLFSGERWVYTFTVPGTYVYFSRYYELEEMFGVIVVTP